MSLDGNHFSGKIPNVFDKLRNLISLGLSGNNFNGQIPPSIGNLTNHRLLDFSQNQLEGPIPSSIYGFSSLSFVVGLKVKALFETRKVLEKEIKKGIQKVLEKEKKLLLLHLEP